MNVINHLDLSNRFQKCSMPVLERILLVKDQFELIVEREQDAFRNNNLSETIRYSEFWDDWEDAAIL
jgi:hypothetical protein